MSNAQRKKAPTPEQEKMDEVLRRMLATPPAPFTPKKPAKPKKK